jgi:hypothetical protein
MTVGRNLRFLGVVSTRAEASGVLKAPGDAVLIERGRPRLFLLSCPCGCGEEFPINLDARAGPAWRLYGGARTALSLFPSVWRESGCESHFIIWRNRILLFGHYDEDIDSSPQVDATATLNDAVREQLPDVGLITFSEIAETLGEVPWDVLMVCRQLVRKGLAREGKGKQRGSFGRV